MKVSLNWLKDYVDIAMDVEDLADLLTMAGLEVEGIHSVGEGFEKIVVAEIVSIRKHPNADRLVLVEVRTGQADVSVVCGATNIREGQRVPLARVGVRLPNGIEIKKSKIRGEPSEGMLCSETELGFGQDANGIMILPQTVPIGADVGEALAVKDTILDISITPNRPDCLCIMGIAREIAAQSHQRIRYPRVSLSEEGEEIHRRTSVTILDPDLCPRYVARMVEGVKIGPSPYWMRNRLERVGIRSISNVVDVTNYVMMECGQPLHAFDFDLLEEGRIVVRRAEEGEAFVTLDGVRRPLDTEMLMICDGVKPVAIAGVMGGLNSEIGDNTRTILLESAYFNPAGNRRTSMTLGLETEAAYRFGRGVDYGGTLTAANRAAQLIQDLAGGRVVSGAVDAYPKPIAPRPIQLCVEKANRILGTDIPVEQARAHLEALELKVEGKSGDVLIVTPPSFRGDLDREIDLVEEIARLDGYEKIPTTLPTGGPAVSSPENEKTSAMERRVMEVLAHYGYYEVITYSFISPDSIDLVQFLPEDQRRRSLRILNPLSADFSILRTSLIPGLLETARYNLAWKNTNLKIFELKKVFFPQDGRLPDERKYLAALATGFDKELDWTSVPRPIDFYDIKGCVEDLLEILQVKGARLLRAEEIPYLHPGKAMKIWVEEEAVGVLGEIHPQVLNNYEIQGKAFLVEIDFGRLLTWAGQQRRFTALPKFPAVYRDLSLVVDEALETGKIVEVIQNLQHPYVEDVTVFDVYQGTPIAEDKKGVSYRIRYQSSDRTLTDEEVNRYHERVISRIREIFNAELRQ